MSKSKPRVWKAWVVTYPHDARPVRVLSETIGGTDCIGPFKALAIYSSKRAAMRRRMGNLVVSRVEIRELPRRGKGAGRGK